MTVQIYKAAIRNINQSQTQRTCTSDNQNDKQFGKVHIFLEIWNLAAVSLLINTQLQIINFSYFYLH
jgi:hypothetical protein